MNGLPSTVSQSVVVYNMRGIILMYKLVCSSAVDFFNQINMLYGTITEQCTTESCPVMSAGPK